LLDGAADGAIEVVDVVVRVGTRPNDAFFDRRLSLVPLKKTEPEMRLPPVFGTTFIVRPPVSDSPRPPEVENVTSSALPTSATYAGG
jgi:hypothetical protein